MVIKNLRKSIINLVGVMATSLKNTLGWLNELEKRLQLLNKQTSKKRKEIK